jgi:hypothetical protein
MSAPVSKGFARESSAFTARARASSSGSIAPVRRRTGMCAVSGSAFRAAQTS